MLSITIHVDAPAGHAIGINEAIAQDLEKYGDVRVSAVEESNQDRWIFGKGVRPMVCKFLGEVRCDAADHKRLDGCRRCGWNQEVAVRRITAARAARKLNLEKMKTDGALK